jgi:hypothetical protein
LDVFVDNKKVKVKEAYLIETKHEILQWKNKVRKPISPYHPFKQFEYNQKIRDLEKRKVI